MDNFTVEHIGFWTLLVAAPPRVYGTDAPDEEREKVHSIATDVAVEKLARLPLVILRHTTVWLVAMTKKYNVILTMISDQLGN